ncbi:hypothetical protein H072_574 [Dactylellina haptotyla CBS 200.50]|uniref:Uncharacterized protein n=1 Tax=Dactylellina haptotyla (strain CBS 200.50) TaxID=1284197 RepID=S8C109_DACHA|nr:hypothetical protein H072_574 [Dactylellina haptotyla CBS 200.50]
MAFARAGYRSYVMTMVKWFQLPTRYTFINPAFVIEKPRHHLQFRRLHHSVPTDLDMPVSSIIISELAKANIGCTSEGVKMFEEACSMSHPDILSDPHDLWRRLRDTWMQSDIDFASLSHFQTSPKSPWRANQQAFEICRDSKVYKMWEALYLSSPIFRGLIDQEEQYAEESLTRLRQLNESMLWWWMRLLVDDGIIKREDIENLPDPVDISKLDIEYI